MMSDEGIEDLPEDVYDEELCEEPTKLLSEDFISVPYRSKNCTIDEDILEFEYPLVCI